MESKRLRTYSMLQRVVTLTRHAQDFRSSLSGAQGLSNHTGWHRQASLNYDQISGLHSKPTNQNLPTYLYPLGPDRKYDFERAKRFLQMELNRRCALISKQVKYEPKQCLDFVQDLSQHLRRVLKSDILNCIRYKIIVIVTILQTLPGGGRNQSIAIVSRCLWNHVTDGSISAEAPLGYDMLANATVFAVYTE